MRALPDVPTTGGLLGKLRDSNDQKARGDFAARYSELILAICVRHLKNEDQANEATQFIQGAVSARNTGSGVSGMSLPSDFAVGFTPW